MQVLENKRALQGVDSARLQVFYALNSLTKAITFLNEALQRGFSKSEVIYD